MSRRIYEIKIYDVTFCNFDNHSSNYSCYYMLYYLELIKQSSSCLNNGKTIYATNKFIIVKFQGLTLWYFQNNKLKPKLQILIEN